ncbi:MAG: flgB [Bacteriovoracaceae bacterium]|nr:flgB [Bacteriovoracaceae bacterium]
MNLIDPNISIMSKALTLRLQRHGVIASNIANADTPGFRPSQVSFEEELQKSVNSKKMDKVQSVTGKVELMDDGVPRADGNSVDMDKQLSSLSENSLTYNATAEFLARKLKMLKSVIS